MLIAVQAAIAAIVGLAYLARRYALRGSASRPAAWRIACFCAGIAVTILAVAVLEARGREEVYVATVLQVLIGDVAPLLLALGLTGAVLAPLARVLLLRRLGVMVRPAAALVLWIANMAVWHLPGPWEAALHHRSLMLLQHLLLAGLGLAVWVAVLGPGAERRWAGRQGRWLGYMLFWRALAVGLGIGGIASPAVFYPHYVQTDVLFTISPLSDQGIAGSILIGESAIVAIGLLLLLYFRLGETADAVSPAAPAQRPVASAGATSAASNAD